MRKVKKIVTYILLFCMISEPLGFVSTNVKADVTEKTIIDGSKFGMDPTGVKDSALGLQAALEAAKQASEDGENEVVLNIPQGEYHIYKDYSQKREYHTSNTNSIENPIKTIGILIEEQKNLTIEGNDSLFMMHGNMMALAIVKSENITLKDLAWDFAVPTVSEMTVVEMGTEEGKEYTDFFIPKCFPYQIKGNTLLWTSEKSPYTGEYYWTETGIHNAYSIVGYHPEEEMTRAYFTSDTPFTSGASIKQLNDTTIRITYSGTRPAMQKDGMILELASSAHRETAGAFTWESKNVVADGVKVHFMHGFGWLVQMSEDVTYRNCDLLPRKDSGHRTVSYADGIHASGAKGEILIENCNFANTHDDPINMHGTFTRVESKEDNTLVLKYIHTQQGGFPQYHEGDKVAFFTRDYLESLDAEEVLYTVEEVISNPGENGTDLRTMKVRFKEELPAAITDKIGTEPKYVAENVTYAPSITIKNCTFKNVPTRGILATTRNKVLIENNTFLNMSMASIYLSNDSNEWYESGPIRDMTIRNNKFYIKSIGRTSWEYAPAIYVHPVTKGGQIPAENNPIHKNLTIEGNTFNMDVDTVVKAESVENLTIRNNKIVRTNPNIKLALNVDKTSLAVGESIQLTASGTGKEQTRAQDNAYEFTKCKNVLLEGNEYDDGLKLYAVVSGMSDSNLTNLDSKIKVTNDRNQSVTKGVNSISYISTNPEVVEVNQNGVMRGKSAGSAEVYAYYEWNGTIYKSLKETITVSGQATNNTVTITGTTDNTVLKVSEGTYTMEATSQDESAINWSVVNYVDGLATTAATIDEAGVLSIQGSGVVVVKAEANGALDSRVLILQEDTSTIKNPGFSIIREDASNYSLVDDNSVQINFQAGDIYQETNTLKNLFLYTLPTSMDANNMKTIVKVQGLPIKESNLWDTASFLLYKDDDNYVTVGKKSHYNGISTVVENNRAAIEAGEAETTNNTVSNAYLGFSYQGGDTVSVDYRLEDGTWTHLSDISASSLKSGYKIGIACWGAKGAGKDVVFSDLKVGSAEVSYADLEQEPAVPFRYNLTAEEGQPQVSDLRFTKDVYTVGDTANVSYTKTVPSGGDNFFYVYKYIVDGVEQKTVSTTSTFVIPNTNEITCTVYPVDGNGLPGVPASVTTTIATSGEETSILSNIMLNDRTIYTNADTSKELTVRVPSDVQKVKLGYTSVNDSIGTTKIKRNGVELTDTFGNTDEVIIEVVDKDVITIERSETDIYKVTIDSIKNSKITLRDLTISEFSFAEAKPENKSYFINAGKTDDSTDISFTTGLNGETVKLSMADGRYNVPLTKEGNTYNATVGLENGLNSFYVSVTAEDGVTQKLYMIHINRASDVNAELGMIKVDGEEIAGFDATVKTYKIDEPSTKKSVNVAVTAGNRKILIEANDKIVEASTADIALHKGANIVNIRSYAEDGISVETYQLNFYLADETDTTIAELMCNDVDILNGFDTEKQIEVSADMNKVTLNVKTQNKDAVVKIVCDDQVVVSRHVVQGTFHIYKGLNKIVVTVTSADGKNVDTRTITAKNSNYLSDIEYESGTAGYGEIQKDKSSSGNQLRLANELGEPVVFAKGIGTHATSVITYAVAGKGYQRFVSYVGVDYAQYNAEYGGMTFIVTVDGEERFNSGEMTQKTPMKKVDIDISGASKVVLTVEKGVNDYNDHADWADAQFIADFPEKPVTPTYTQTITKATNGTITSSVAGDTLTEGERVTYTFTADKDYKLKKALVNGKEVVVTNNKYTIEAIKENVVISAEFEKKQEELENGWISVGNKKYYYIAGVLQKGWLFYEKNWYYLDAKTGVMTKGWKDVDGIWYYMNTDGKMATGWKKLSGVWYYLSNNGKMAIGWREVAGSWYYMKSNGKMTKGWQKIGNAWYLMASNGKMTTGWQKLGNAWYLMASNGKMTTGWQKSGNAWYLMASNGKMTTGWQKSGNAWYLMASNGKMTTGWKKVSKKWYYMKSNGKMAIGWQNIGNKRYFLNVNGEMVTGWYKIKGKQYQFDSQGVWTGATK